MSCVAFISFLYVICYGPNYPMNAMNTINPSNPMTDLPYLGVLHTACDSDAGIVAERKKEF